MLRLPIPCLSSAHLLAAPLLAVVVGCGDISNDIFAEDAEFLAAFPDSDRQSVGFEGDTTDSDGSTDRSTAPDGRRARASLGDRADLVDLSIAVSGNVNAFIFGVLDAIDGVRELRPAERTDDGRRWGPYDWQCGVTLSVVMSRDAGVYGWSVGGHVASSNDSSGDGGDATLIFGTHYAGTSVAGGDGQFTWDHSRYSQWCDLDETGVLTVDYDNREGVDLLVQIAGYSKQGAEASDKTWTYSRTDEVGDYQFRTSTDLADDGSDEEATVTMRNRWIPGTGGRSDAMVTGGGFRDQTWTWSQCWDARGRLTWEGDDLGLIEESGNAADCVYGDVAEVDRI